MPQTSLIITYLLTSSLSIFSAIFDVNFDSYRLSYIKKIQYATVNITTLSSLGHKSGFVISTSIALLVAHFSNWSNAFLIVAGILIFSGVYIFNVIFSVKRHPTPLPSTIPPFLSSSISPSISHSIQNKRIFPFPLQLKLALKGFFAKKNSKKIFLSVIFFKLGKTLYYTTIIPFYLQIGLNKIQIALFANLYDALITIFGIYLSAIIIRKIGFYNTTLTAFYSQILIYPFLIILNHTNKLSILICVISFDSLLTGIIINLFIIYLSELVDREYLTIQYSFLMSISGIISNFFSLFSGTWIKYFGWDNYYMLLVIISFPGIIFFMQASKKDNC